jgi:ribosomal protein S21
MTQAERKMEVLVQNDNIERAILQLRKGVYSSGLFREYKRSLSFETRTQRRKRKDRLALARRPRREKRGNR